MALLFLDTVKYWSKTVGITVGMSFLRTYSNMYIFIHNQCSNIYNSNKTVQHVCNTVLSWTHPIMEWVYLKKIEPFYEPWCTILYHSNHNLCEYYLNLNKPSHYVPLFNKHMLFYYNPFAFTAENFTCETIQNILQDISNIWSNSSEPLLIIIKTKHQYISRVNTKKIKKISLEKTRKHLLCVEYIHPKMKKSIYLDIHPGYYVEGNEIFSELFVERCLRYQKSAYVFDSDYTLKIMDSMMRTVEMHSNEYMIVDKNNYIIYKQ